MYFGSFPVIDRMGTVDYRLQLAAASSIHPVVHVSQLRLALGFRGTVSSLPTDASQYHVPMQILESQMVVCRGRQAICRSRLPRLDWLTSSLLLSSARSRVFGLFCEIIISIPFDDETRMSPEIIGWMGLGSISCHLTSLPYRVARKETP
jgi:hypothetical protein